MPVLAISGRQLADARGDAARIMVDRVSSAIVADRTRTRISRVYLVLNDERSWRREGYVNIGIVRKLFEVRHRRGGEEFGALRKFYLVSIPSSRAFFLAAGPPGPDTTLIPIESDPDLCTREGVEVSAGKVLPRVYQNMLREAGLPFERDVLRCRGS
jgi:hypothetical protein